jgi:hypothetical protein
MLSVAYVDPLWAEGESPLKRLGEDIAEVVAFLAPERSAYITGATIHVNGYNRVAAERQARRQPASLRCALRGSFHLVSPTAHPDVGR